MVALLRSVLQIRCWAKASSPAAFKVEITNCHCHSQKNKKQTSVLADRPASLLPPEENGFCVKLSQLNLKPSDVSFRFCYKPRTQAKFGGKKKTGKVSSKSRPIYGFEWKPYSIHYFHRGLIWNQAQSGSLKLIFALGYIESQTQHVSPSIQIYEVLARRKDSQSQVL